MCSSSSDTTFDCGPERDMRVVISAPRKSGGAHLRCLLSMAYDLKAPPLSPPGSNEPTAVAAWLAGLPENSVSTCDIPHADIEKPASASGVHLVGIIRHPFDLFVSNFDVLQQRAVRGVEDDENIRSWSHLSGQDLDGEPVRQFATTSFAIEVRTLRDWSNADCSVRYEDLLAEPGVALQAVSDSLGPLSEDQVRHAVALCPAENVVLSRPGRGRRMPALPPGSWRERLPASLATTLRDTFGADVVALGYEAD